MTNYVLKLTDENFQSGQGYTLFTWPTEPGSLVICHDYKPTLKCGNGFHGYLNGEGSLASPHKEKALILEVEDYISLDDGDKIKFEKATVLFSGEVHEVTTKLRELVGNKAIHYSHEATTLDKQIMLAGSYSTQTAGDYSTQKAGSNSTQTADSYSTQTAGYSSTQTAGYSSTQTAGSYSTQTAGYSSTQTAGSNSTQKAGDNSTMKIYGSVSYVVKSGKNCILIQYYNDKKSIIDLDETLKDFEIGDRILIKEGKVVGKVY
jgi:hypothetical protein